MLYQLNKGVSESAAPVGDVRWTTRQIITRILLFAVPIVIFLALAIGTHGNKTMPGDIAILNTINEFSFPQLDKIEIAISNVSDVAPVVVASLVAIGILFFFRQRGKALFLATCIAGTAALGFIFKLIFDRSRPDLWPPLVHESTNSFPSGHAITSSTIVLCVIIFCWHTKFRILAICLGILYVLAVALSRLYLGVHYPSDIVAGWCVSIVLVAAVYYVFRYLKSRFFKTAKG